MKNTFLKDSLKKVFYQIKYCFVLINKREHILPVRLCEK